jgi:hypothetical protein
MNRARAITLAAALTGAAALVTVAAFSASRPAAAQQGASVSGTEGWYAFTPTNSTEPSAIGMEDWADRPAGGRGRITRAGDRLVYGGKPLKLWGLNLCYGDCAPEKALADRRAAFYAKYGINAVRLHKFADGPGWAGIQSPDSAVEFDAAALDRMDYQVAQFKKAGIFVLLSAHFGTLKLGPADKKYVPFVEELGRFGGGDRNRIETPHSAIPYSPELQDVQIRQIVNLLKHKNPYTGLTYAEDPAVSFVEAANEQSILFYTSLNPLKQSVTIRRQAGEQFSDWLKAKYGTQEKLAAAWGGRAFDSFEGEGFAKVGESLEKRNILPVGNPWFWDPDQIHGSQAWRARRLLDTMQFLYEIQSRFYERYTVAVRAAGYQGEVLGSNWQAGRAYSHYLNLHSNWRAGTIDRHNYFGGSTSPDKPFDNASMLRAAGTATLSTGFQQAADRPFMLSEWIHVFPNEWGVEGPALLGAYGFGLQGWDASFLFQNRDDGRFSARIGRDTWDATAPQVLGIFPAVARQVRRGDVKESTLLAPLNVHVPSLAEGKIGFKDETAQAYDLKGFATDKVPARTLAVARTAVRFTGAEQPTPAFSVSPFEKNGFLISSTGQLRWKEGRREKLGGYFTVDTPGTKGVVGFASGQECRLGDVSLTPQSRFGAVYVSAKEPGATLDTSRSLIVVALARARNTGMTFSPEEDRLLTRGEGPVLLEPVKATVVLGGKLAGRVTAVNVLDHDGRRTGKTLPVTGGRFTIDGARDRTPYYEVVLR